MSFDPSNLFGLPVKKKVEAIQDKVERETPKVADPHEVLRQAIKPEYYGILSQITCDIEIALSKGWEWNPYTYQSYVGEDASRPCGDILGAILFARGRFKLIRTPDELSNLDYEVASFYECSTELIWGIDKGFLGDIQYKSMDGYKIGDYLQHKYNAKNKYMSRMLPSSTEELP